MTPPTRPRWSVRAALNEDVPFDGTVVIGEGERDEAPMLYIGEKVGAGRRPQDRHRARPARGNDDHRRGEAQRAAVLAIAEERVPAPAPDVYMEKLAIGPDYPDGTIDLNRSHGGVSEPSPPPRA